jgi:predicted DNA repair protein MutK
MTGCVPYTGVNINYENTLEIYHVDISTNNTQYKCIATNAKGQDEYVWQVRVAPEVMEAQVMIGMIAAIVIVVGIVAYAAYKFSSHHKKNSGLKIYEHREVPMDLCSWNKREFSQ